MAFPQAFLDELKNRSEITSVISSYVNLRRSSRNLVGLCPFHSEKSPSFTVFPETQSYYCFGCGAGGDVITFVRNIENLDYPEAVRFLAQRAGMTVPENGEDDAAARLKARVYEINRLAARWFFDRLVAPEGEAARAYLLGRKLTVQTIRHFGLGWAPESFNLLTDYLKGQGYTDRELVTAGVAGQSKKTGRAYDYFRGRVMFPIIDLRGSVIGFGGRVLGDEKPKYLNSPDTPVFKKTKNLFALNFAKNSKEQRLILVEGNVDVITLHQAGFTNTVATLGTALTDDQARLIAGYAKEVVVAYDSDGAGRKATTRAFSFFDELGVKVRVLNIPGAKDPDEYIKKFGAQRFKMLLDESASVTDYKLSEIAQKNDVSTPSGKVGYLKEAASVLADIRSPVERDVYIRKLGNDLGVSHEAIAEQVKNLLRRRRKAQEKQDADNLVRSVSRPDRKEDPDRTAHKKAAVCEDTLLSLLYKNPDKLETVTDKLSEDDFVTGQNRRVFEALCRVIRESGVPDLTRLSAFLNDADLSHMSRLIATAPPFDSKMLEDCIRELKTTARAPDETAISKMDDDALASYIDQLKKGKK
ncbi:MAG TPA: DNA primase [Ruminococcaceae bacterium]|nr:DNA primase [Oscillospiraceae bacterium]